MKETEKKIPMVVIKRLPKYLNYLLDLMDRGIVRTSSQELSALTGFTASQIRQDFNNFGGFGQQGYGYNVEELYSEIRKILGLDASYNMIVVGAGNMGHAITNYIGFEKMGFCIIGLFDVNPKLIGTEVRGVKIQDMSSIKDFLSEHEVDIAVVTLPKAVAPKIADHLVKLGVRAIWNFSPVDLKLSEDVVVENVHLSESLMTLAYKVKRNNTTAEE